jgi:predicted DNA binding protein
VRYVTVEVREYDPDHGRLYSTLTARQLEVLDVALEKGYYDAPRRATHEAVAAELVCSAATVGEHLRKIERQVFTALRG